MLTRTQEIILDEIVEKNHKVIEEQSGQFEPQDFMYFEYKNHMIIDPYYDENSSTTVDPIEYYGEHDIKNLIGNYMLFENPSIEAKKAKAVEVLNHYGIKAKLDEFDDIQIFEKRDKNVRVFYSAVSECLSFKTTSLDLSIEDAEEMRENLDKVIEAFKEIKRFAPELIDA